MRRMPMSKKNGLPVGLRVVVMSGLRDRIVCGKCGARCIRDSRAERAFLVWHPKRCVTPDGIRR